MKSWWQLQVTSVATLLLAFDRQFSCTLIKFKLVKWESTKVSPTRNESWEESCVNSRSPTLINSHVGLTFVPVWPEHQQMRVGKLQSMQTLAYHAILPTLINSHATLVLVWPGHVTDKSWEEVHCANSRSLACQLSFDRSITRWELRCFMHLQTVACQLSSTLACSCLTGAWELRNFTCKLSLVNTSHASTLSPTS